MKEHFGGKYVSLSLELVLFKFCENQTIRSYNFIFVTKFFMDVMHSWNE
jgi:hypothetical protein